MTAPRPYTLVAELTYRCPLRCPYCSNPTDHARRADVLDTAAWLSVFEQAETLGVVQVHLTGGEPLVRHDLEPLVERARRLELYTQLVTSGIPLTRARLAGLRARGLDAVQLSMQDADPSAADRMAGRAAFVRKLEVARWTKELGFPLTLNVVLQRENVGRVAEIVALAERLEADRLELANVQYLGWALDNRAALLPTRAALDRARAAAATARARLAGRMEIVFVMPDYWSDRPKPCMDGWARRYVVVSPDGLALPCAAAHTLPGLHFDSVRDRPLADIWSASPAFNAFRGDGWMPSPCRECPQRSADFGGCRCQAFHLTGDAAATDPACALSPFHDVVLAARARADGAAASALRYRGASP